MRRLANRKIEIDLLFQKKTGYDQKSPSKPRIYVEPEIIGAGKFVRGRRAPEARSCEWEGKSVATP
jgi:hypothetical protein